MNFSLKTIIILNACLLGSLNAQSAEWSQYRGPLGNGKSDEAITAESFHKGMKKPLWKVETPSGFSSFTTTGVGVYTIVTRESNGENRETCIALDTTTGIEKWAVPLSSSDYGHGGGDAGAPGNRGGDGARNTPTVDGNRIYVYDGHLVLTCINSESGSILWQIDVVKQFSGRNIKWYNASSPVLKDNAVFVGGGGPGQSFLAFDKMTGEPLWKSGDEIITHATPHIAKIDGKEQIIFFVQSGLVALDLATGIEQWRSEFPFSVSTAASPVSAGNQVYCSAGYGVGAALFQVNQTKEASEIWFKPNQLMNHWSTPIIHEGHLYGIYEFKKYGRAPLQCVELKTGDIKWSHPGFGPGNVILVGDKLLVLSDAGEIAMVQAKPDEYEELGRSQAITGKCWSTPAFSDGKLYIRSTTEGACFDLSP